MTGSRTTITAVAAHAGVSVSTVSRVMNDYPTVAADIARRVRESASALGYTASPMARSLVLGRTQTVAVVVPDLGNPTFQGVLRGVTRAADREGYHLLVAETAEDVDSEPLKARTARGRCDALVLVSPRMPDDLLRELVAELAPVVVVNRHATDLAAPTLGADYRYGITLLAEHLRDLGHTHLAYVAGRPESYSDAERRAGLAQFGASNPHVSLDVLPGGVMHEVGVAAAESVIASGATAVLAFNDLVAMGLLSALHARGVDVPGDVSVVGFDDIPLAAFTTPALTTVGVPVTDIGEEAWARLSRRLAGSTSTGDLTFRPRLMVRASSGPPPRA